MAHSKHAISISSDAHGDDDGHDDEWNALLQHLLIKNFAHSRSIQIPPSLRSHPSLPHISSLYLFKWTKIHVEE